MVVEHRDTEWFATVRSHRRRYDAWEKDPTQEHWQQLFRGEFTPDDVAAVKRIAFARENLLDSFPQILKERLNITGTESLEELDALFSRQKAERSEPSGSAEKDEFSLEKSDYQFDTEAAPSELLDRAYFVQLLNSIGMALAQGQRTLPPKAARYLGKALLRIGEGVPPDKALNLIHPKPSTKSRDEWITADYLRRREKGVKAEVALLEVADRWNVGRDNVRYIAKKYKTSVEAKNEVLRETWEGKGRSWDEVIESMRFRTFMDEHYKNRPQMSDEDRERYLDYIFDKAEK